MNYSKTLILADIPHYTQEDSSDIKGYKGWLSYSKPYKYNSSQDRDLVPDELYTNYAIEVLNEKPFMLAVGYTVTHTPYYAPQNYIDRFPLASVQVAKFEPVDLKDRSIARTAWLNNEVQKTDSCLAQILFLICIIINNIGSIWR